MNRRTLGASALSLVAAGLTLGIPAAAQADTTAVTVDAADTPHGHALHGTVVSVDKTAKTLVVAVKHGDDAAVNVTVDASKATVHVPGAHGKKQRFGKADLGSVAKGDKLVAQGRYTSATAFTARRLHVVPGKRTVHATGTASVDAGAKTITVTTGDGTKVTFSYNADTKVRPEGKTVADAAGKKVTVVGRRQADGTVLATGVSIEP